MRYLAILVVLLLVLPPTGTAAADADHEIDEIVTIARGGAPALALRLLDAYQSRSDVGTWMFAERERLAILAARGDWEEVLAREDAIPAGVHQAFLDWRAERQVQALLHLGRGAESRELLRRLIWRVGAPDAETLRVWRRLLIRSWLVERDREPALVALRRYVQDYGQADSMLRALHGEALLLAGHPTDALEALGEGDADPIRSLRWLAQLRSDAASAGAVMQEAVRAGSARDAEFPSRRAAWRVVAEAATLLGDHAMRISALERAIAAERAQDVLPAILETRPEELWALYRDWGRALGNAAQLIVGEDQDWLEAAEARVGERPFEARALYAELAFHSDSSAVVGFAHHRFARSLAERPDGARVLAALYLRSGLFAAPERIPEVVRYPLVEEAIRAGDIGLASRLVADLVNPPAGTDSVDWTLRRARVMVLAGRHDAAAGALRRLLETGNYPFDRLLQVLFDMQTADAHEQALPVFRLLLETAELEPQRRRELLFWTAESERAVGRHAEAARLYLRSANLADPYAMDPWAQTARYQAAEVLARAGLREDAVTILQGLLNVTEDASRRAVLRAQIEQYSR